ncbi:MAG: RNA 2'-phosphotransferase [Bacteroidetes bacterium]|nr:MAG: RNA 2'-phosphotransferase [Bacteroidota bacterium]
MSASHVQISKLLSKALRHQPDVLGISLDEQGWTDIDILLQKLREKGIDIEELLLREVVAENDKQRFRISDDGSKIRASQGHTIPVSLEYEAVTPPEDLYHGTVARFLDAIRETGIQRMKRHHVHLSKDEETAVKVGQRRGQAVILRVRAGEMHRAGYVFFRSENGVWLTDHVPSQYIEFS